MPLQLSTAWSTANSEKQNLDHYLLLMRDCRFSIFLHKQFELEVFFWRPLPVRSAPLVNGMRCTKGSTANTAKIVSVILTEFDSSSHTYKSICVIKEMVPATRENIPAIL
jgi:hypothetical protein